MLCNCNPKMNYSTKLLLTMSIAFWTTKVLGAEPQVPCYFLFGDSIVDNGNNNNVANTDDKANYPPYGLDLPAVPRGRFTNGRTVTDLVGQFLGFDELIPPFLTSRGNETLRGVNYASGGSGIRDETGKAEGVTSLSRQIKNHLRTILTIMNILGLSKTESRLKKCIYAINIGSNDYLNNYFKTDEYPTSSIYTPKQFAKVLAAQYSQQIQILYHNGARKIALFGLGELGCIPILLNGTLCLETINDVSGLFNTRLVSLVHYLNRRHPDAMFTYLSSRSNTSLTALDEIPNYGPCCEVAKGEAGCSRNGTVCGNRSDYLFWDAIHPSEAANMIYAKAAYNATSQSDACPYDIRHLAEGRRKWRIR